MKITKIDHVAVCVKNIDEATATMERVLGIKGVGREYVESQKTDAVLFPMGESNIELISPNGNPGLEKFLEKRGPGLHHVALEVEGIDRALVALKELGVRLIDEEPRKGARGHRVAFVHPAATGGLLIELVEPDAHHEG